MGASAMKVGLLGLWFCWIFLVTRVSGLSDNSLVLPQCMTNVDCAEQLACIDLQCEDPCPGPCHGNATCEIYNHVPFCSCKPGFSGNPFIGCQQVPASETVCSLTVSIPSGRKVYRVERSVKANYFAALAHCMEHGGRLASIESENENTLIKEAISNSGIRNSRFWTSGTNLALGQWIWMSSGVPLPPDYSDWWPGEPNNRAGEEHCLELYEDDKKGYMWNDDYCKQQHYMICEYCE